ncbi:MAG TPA: GIY-YIG nuclease family protein [Gammaproteobacteria bacterium]
MTSWCLYIVKCTDGSLYTGITLDVSRRLKEHEDGKGSKYLRGRGPLELVFSHQFESRNKALRQEARLKKWPRRKKEQLIRGEILLLPEAE